jgi:hypothetical protein
VIEVHVLVVRLRPEARRRDVPVVRLVRDLQTDAAANRPAPTSATPLAVIVK